MLARMIHHRCLRSSHGNFIVFFSACWLSFFDWAPGQSIDFDKDVRPVLEQHCWDCHGPDLAEANLRLDSEPLAFQGGDSGEPAIVAGDPSRSYLLARIQHADPSQRMPPDSDPLAAADIEILQQWVDDVPRWQAIADNASTATLEHWSFQPLTRPERPGKAVHPIDDFIQHRLEQDGLALGPIASPTDRIRRLALVVEGLPPTYEAIQSFAADPSETVWLERVEAALQSEHYGERMAAHWLDLVRFGETHGFETNRERPHAWRYRDWVVDAFNQDLPYDEFVRRQIAGDALDDPVATGFLVAGPYDLVKGQDELLGLTQRQDELADILNTTGTAFLGLTIGCARCHNHKFDPISQSDYYAMQAIFAGVQHGDQTLPLPPTEKQRRQELDRAIEELWVQLRPFFRPAVAFALNEEEFSPTDVRFVRMTIERCTGGEPCIDELEVFSGQQNVALSQTGTKATSGGDFQHPLHRLVHINDGQYGNAQSWIAAQASGGWVQLEFPEIQTINRITWARDRTGQFQDRLAIDYRLEGSINGTDWLPLATSKDRLPFASGDSELPEFDFSNVDPTLASEGQKQLDSLRRKLQQRQQLATPPQAYAGNFNEPGPTYRLYRGEPTAPREQVAPAAVASLSDWQLEPDSPEQQRRLGLANWIASSDNPLTARVMVNRLWQYHFGTGMVDTASDFGANGTPPSHPELLDWLACELIENGWSIKHLQRLILTSLTWQQSGLPNSQALQKDSDSRLLWRFPPRRLSAEGIRDCMLVATNVLDRTAGGPGFSAFQVEEENVRHYHPKEDFGPEDWRRMIYMTKVRQERDAVFGVFDCPDFNQVVPKRSRSTTPLQALNLFNSRFVLQQAELLNQRLDQTAQTPSAKIQQAYRLCYGREPSESELEASLTFVQQTDWVQFARAILNSNEFVFIP